MTSTEQQTRAKFCIMAAIEAAQEEGCKRVHIARLWGGSLCVYMGWRSYMDGVFALANDGAFRIENHDIVIKRRKS